MGIELKKEKKSIGLASEVLRGKAGGYYVPSVDTEGNLTWQPTEENMPAVEPANIHGKDVFLGIRQVYRVNGQADFEELVAKLIAGRAAGNFININIINDGKPFIIRYNTTLMMPINTGTICSLQITTDGYVSSALTIGNYVVEDDGYIFTVIDDYDGQEKHIPVLNGKQGIQGEQGIQGKQGEQGIQGISITGVEVDADNHIQVSFSTGETHDAGKVQVRESEDYVLIKTITTTQEDNDNNIALYTFEVDDDGNEFLLKDIIVYFDVPKMSASKPLAVLINKSDISSGLLAAHKRASATATSASYTRVDCHLRGFWTGESVRQTDADANAAATLQSTIKKNGLRHPAFRIGLECGATFPVGTVIEVWGVKM